jgi:hypothetical protein
MNRLLIVAIGGLVAVSAFGQQPGPEGQNTNRDTPAINASAITPSTPKVGTSSTSPATNKNPAASGTGSTVPSSPAPAPGASQSAATTPTEQPTTEMLPQGTDLSSADPVLARKELPKKDMSLIGGTALKVDKIRNRVELQPFGGGKKIRLTFDDGSHIYRDGRETTVMGINKGDRVYADTMLIQGKVYARNLRVLTKSGPAESRGQVSSFNPRTGRIDLRDTFTGQTISFDVTKQTAMQRRGSPASPADLKPGTLLDVMFAPGHHGGTAEQISVLAVPGESFVFAGHVTDLDLSRGVLAMDNESDDKNYEVHFNPANLEDRQALRVGSEVTARATFDGRTYHAKKVMITGTASAQE